MESFVQQYFFVSDLHMGDGSGSDDFNRQLEFMLFLDKVNTVGGTLVLIGDIYELWQARLCKIYWAHRLVIQTLHNMEIDGRIIFIHGNHDYLPFHRYWLEYFEDSLYDFVAYHGHQHDVFNRFGNPLRALRWPIGKHITVALAGLEKYLHPDVDVWADRMRKKFGQFIWDAAILQNKEGFNSTNSRSIVPYKCKSFPFKLRRLHILGHTHDAEIVKLDNGLIYANCGTWVGEKTPTYLLLEECPILGKILSLRDGITHYVIDELKY
jgi:UDP-2,3-diacylglucosamine pyrophosphatase LpxH